MASGRRYTKPSLASAPVCVARVLPFAFAIAIMHHASSLLSMGSLRASASYLSFPGAVDMILFCLVVLLFLLVLIVVFALFLFSCSFFGHVPLFFFSSVQQTTNRIGNRV